MTAAAATVRRLAPGLALAAAGVLAATLLSARFGASPPVRAVAAAALLGSLGLLGHRTGPGLRFAAKRLLRAGVVLLGLRLSLGEVGALGAPTLAVVAAVVGAAFLEPGRSPADFGRFAGASVHDVAQAVATAGGAGPSRCSRRWP